jgi:hypothetical protein
MKEDAARDRSFLPVAAQLNCFNGQDQRGHRLPLRRQRRDEILKAAGTYAKAAAANAE